MHRGKMEQILLVHSREEDTDYIDIVTGLLKADKLALHLFIIGSNYVLSTFIDKMKDNGLKLTSERRRYAVKIITDADYADDRALLINTRIQTETLPYSLKRAAAGLNVHVNADETEYM